MANNVDARELAAAESEAKASAAIYNHTFGKPFSYEGKTYETLHFNFGNLTGRDAIAIEDELNAQGKAVIVPVMSGAYLIRMASRACEERLGSDAFEAMPISDYNKIRSAARSFLLRSE